MSGCVSSSDLPRWRQAVSRQPQRGDGEIAGVADGGEALIRSI